VYFPVWLHSFLKPDQRQRVAETELIYKEWNYYKIKCNRAKVNPTWKGGVVFCSRTAEEEK
jgi:hypothetical protein